MTEASRQSLFTSLRRDRLLFALVSTLILLLQTVLPLAAAQTPQDRHLVICTIHGVADSTGDTGEASDPFDSCPVCMTGGTCWNMALGKADPATASAFPAPDTLLVIAPFDRRAQTGPAGRQGAPSPSIRAPPVSA